MHFSLESPELSPDSGQVGGEAASIDFCVKRAKDEEKALATCDSTRHMIRFVNNNLMRFSSKLCYVRWKHRETMKNCDKSSAEENLLKFFTLPSSACSAHNTSIRILK